MNVVTQMKFVHGTRIFFYSYYSPRGNKLRNVVNLNFDRKTVFFIRVLTPQQIL